VFQGPAILAMNTTATQGAIAALKTTHSSGHIIIIGCDYNFDLLILLRRKVLDALVIQNMHQMGSMAVDEVMAEAQGVPVSPYTIVEPVLITRENIDDEAIQRMIYMDWRVRP
jgi:ribose transport system substrate-binding protein